MIKKAAAVCSCILAVLALCGCWSYRGLDDLAIVTAMAIDLDDSGEYELTYETADLSGAVKQQGYKPLLIESRGATLFDAARNAKRKTTMKLYFGHMQIVIISESIARGKDITGLIDWFLRDTVCRETLNVVVSLENNARGLLSVKAAGNPLVGIEMEMIVSEDRRFTLSIPDTELYKIYDIEKAGGVEPALPAFRIAYNNGQPGVEAYGTAVYKDGRMTGTLSPEETKYYLFAQGKVEGGVLTFPSAGEKKDNATLQICRSRTDRSFTYADGKLKMLVKTDIDAFLDEYTKSTNDVDLAEINALEAAAADCLVRRIGEVIKKVQTEYASDIFGFGEVIHKHNPGLWKQLKGNWEENFKSLDIEVHCRIKIVNTATTKE